MSTLTFLPYIGEHFSKEYIIPNYIGESLSSLIPGILAISQGLQTSDEHCKSLAANLTSNQTISESLVINLHRPNFSVSVYFFLMFVLLTFSIFAFTLLNFTESAILSRKPLKITRISFSALEQHENNELDDDGGGGGEGVDSMSVDYLIASSSSSSSHHRTERGQNETNPSLKNNRLEIRSLLVLIFFVTFFYYGYLPGLLSFSTIPYSPKFFNLAMNLSKKQSS